MSRHSSFGHARQPSGLTLIEIVVAVVITTIVMAIVSVGLMRARESARRIACTNKLRNIGLALHNFEDRYNHLPSSWTSSKPDASGKIDGWSAQARLLPFLGYEELSKAIDFHGGFDTLPEFISGDSLKLSEKTIPALVCPDQPRGDGRDATGPHRATLNYAVNLGVWFVYDPASGRGGNGVFYPGSRISLNHVSDGNSYTVALAEVKAFNPIFHSASFTSDPGLVYTPSEICDLSGEFDATGGHGTWVNGRVDQTGFTSAFPPNTKISCPDQVESDIDWSNQFEGQSATVPTYAAITSRSHHHGGVNAVTLDGAVRWVSNQISRPVWQAVTTRQGNESYSFGDTVNEMDLLVATGGGFPPATAAAAMDDGPLAAMGRGVAPPGAPGGPHRAAMGANNAANLNNAARLPVRRQMANNTSTTSSLSLAPSPAQSLVSTAASSTGGTQVNLNFSSVTSNNSSGDGINISNVKGSSSINIGSTTVNNAAGTGISVEAGGAGSSLTANFGTTSIDAGSGIALSDRNDNTSGSVSVSFDSLNVTSNNGTGLLLDDNNDGTFGGSNFNVNLGGSAANVTSTNGAALDITGGVGQTNGTSGWTFGNVSSTASGNYGVRLDNLNNSLSINNASVNSAGGNAISVENYAASNLSVTINNAQIDSTSGNAIRITNFGDASQPLPNALPRPTFVLNGGTITNQAGDVAINVNNFDTNNNPTQGADANIFISSTSVSFASALNMARGINVRSGDGIVIIAGTLVDLNGSTNSIGIFVEGNNPVPAPGVQDPVNANNLFLGNGLSSGNVTMNPGVGSSGFNFNHGNNIAGSIEVDGVPTNP